MTWWTDRGYGADVPRDDWMIGLGEVTTRSVVASIFGGSVHSGGVVPSDTSDTIMLFSDPEVGKENGYNFDGVRSDGTGYDYTGAGRVGDQKTTGPNGSVLNHKVAGRTLHLFVADGLEGSGQAKAQRYIGEFTLNEADPFRWEIAPDRYGHTRSVVVFHLLAVGETLLPALPPADAAPGPAAKPEAHLVPLEVDSVMLFEVQASEPVMAQKDEAALVADFVASSQTPSDQFARWAIRIPGEKVSLLTDVFDPMNNVLYEAKSAATRTHVRAAVAQLLDYRRHVAVPDLQCRVLLPARPSIDLQAFVQECGIGLVVRENGAFVNVF